MEKKSTTLKSNYSHINAACKAIYGEKIDNIYPSIYWLIGSCAKKQIEPKKQARPFEPEEFTNYFSHVDIENYYQLVRCAVAIAGYFGGLRAIEHKSINYEGKNFFIASNNTLNRLN